MTLQILLHNCSQKHTPVQPFVTHNLILRCRARLNFKLRVCSHIDLFAESGLHTCWIMCNKSCHDSWSWRHSHFKAAACIPAIPLMTRKNNRVPHGTKNQNNGRRDKESIPFLPSLALLLACSFRRSCTRWKRGIGH